MVFGLSRKERLKEFSSGIIKEKQIKKERVKALKSQIRKEAKEEIERETAPFGKKLKKKAKEKGIKLKFGVRPPKFRGFNPF